MNRRFGHCNYDGKIAGLYDLEETLGSGHFAVVKLARHVFTGEKVAVKVIDKSKLDEISRAHLFQEVRCMKLVQHPNVVRLYEVIDTQTKLYLILELGDGGDLYDYIMRHDRGLSEELARTYFRQIVKAISYCHRLHVVHRDLKPENVVFFEKLGLVKLTDFGFSNRFCPGQKLETSCGSLAYSAPEILLGDSYDAPAVDVWSLGVILYMLVCGQAPFQEANDSETLTMIMDCKYSIPTHVSEECKQLIARMLVREPERRATLDEIAEDPWLLVGSEMDPVEALPLVSRHQVSDEHHSLIITKMVNGHIATKEEILEALDKNEYNHITATYFLLAERKLRASRQEQMQGGVINNSRSQQNDLSSNDSRVDKKSIGVLNPALLNVPRLPGELVQNVRTRKCSIVQEEEDEDDVSSCSGKDERGSNSTLNSFNRRGSRSEGKLSHVLQERLSQLPEKHANIKTPPRHEANKLEETLPKNSQKPTEEIDHKKEMKTQLIQESKTATIENKSSPVWGHVQTPLSRNKHQPGNATFLTESSTAPTPLRTTVSIKDSQLLVPKYRTMPSPSNTNGNQKNANSPPQLTLNEILEDGDAANTDASLESTSGHVVKSHVIRRPGYEQRRSKFHKTRTTSCSSSDASDDDSESRKKRAHKIGSAGKPLPARRDSHDDSSDSQDPSGTGGGGGGGTHNLGQSTQTSNRTESGNDGGGGGSSDNRGDSGSTTINSGSQRCNEGNGLVYGRRHRAGRRRTGETRLRESQSLNRITEVQEAEPQVPRATVTATPNVPTVPPKSEKLAPNTHVSKNRGLGARLLQGWSKSAFLASVKSSNTGHKDTVSCTSVSQSATVHRGDCKGSRKMRLLSRYFAVHKKLCVPLPGLFGMGRLYKARSCGNIVKERTGPTSPKSILLCDDKWREQRHHWSQQKHRGSDGDINQNLGLATFVPDDLAKGCVGLPPMCHVHLGNASKCCSLC